MRRLADELGIRAPSLYRHLPGRDAVVGELVNETLFETGERMHAAVSAPDVDRPGRDPARGLPGHSALSNRTSTGS